MPMGEYSDFQDCLDKNSDKENPEGYCGAIRNRIEGKELSEAEKAMLNPTVEQRIDGLTRLVKSIAGKIGSVFTKPPETTKDAASWEAWEEGGGSGSGGTGEAHFQLGKAAFAAIQGSIGTIGDKMHALSTPHLKAASDYIESQIVNWGKGRAIQKALQKEIVARGAIKEAEPTQLPLSAFTLTKDAKGDLRWFSVVSGNFKDRDREIFPADVHQEYMDFLDRTKEYPELRIWHTPGTRLGVADWADTQSGFMMMSGPIDKDKESIAQTLAAMPDQGMSHGFKFHYREPGVIGFYRTFEVSVLPLTHAAFPWTKLEITKETSMKPEKRSYLEQVLGKDRVEAIIGQADTLQKSLVAAGIEWKDFDPVPPATPVKAEDLVSAFKATEEYKAIAAIPEKLEKLTKDYTDVTAIFDASIKALQVENAALKDQIKAKQDDLLASLLRPRAQGVVASKSEATKIPATDPLATKEPKLPVSSALANSVAGLFK